MKYVDCINALIREQVLAHDHLVCFGQNVNAGSCIGGFTRGISVKQTSRIVNSTNAENSLCGFGFGIMIRGASAIFFMKQLDFLLLGIDQLVNTFNIIRNQPKPPCGSFTIMPIVMDNGFQGPQSSLNTFAEFCSIASIPGYTVTNQRDAEAVLRQHMVAPGFRIIAVSQRLFREEVIVPEREIMRSADASLFQYEQGDDATIVSFNFAFPQASALAKSLAAEGIRASLFNVNSPTPVDWSPVIDDVRRTRRLVVLDDSKSRNLSCHGLRAEARAAVPLAADVVLTRRLGDDWLTPVSDTFEVSLSDVVAALRA
jgi:pyruvate dehydrogenase E1 component beta subunit